MSSCRLKTPSFSNSSTCFGGPQVCCVHTGADGPFAAVAQLGPRSLYPQKGSLERGIKNKVKVT